MISILAQERVLVAVLGSAFSGVMICEQRRDIYKTIAQNRPKSELKRPNCGNKSRFEFGHYWNKAMDQIFGPAIQVLSS